MTTTLAERLAAGLLAEGATTASRHAGPCARCQRAILAGDRYAVLPGGKRAHVPCVGRPGRAAR